MARNISGIYSLPAGSIVTTGDTILAASHNDPLNDIASDLNAARPIVAGGTGADNAAGALVNLGLTATAAELNALDGITATVTELNYTDGVTSNIQTQLDAKQPLDTDLTAIASLTSAADKLPYATGSGTWALANFSSFGRSLVDDADAETARNTLGAAGTASPAFTGAPTAPTAAVGTNSTQLATTGFVNSSTGVFAGAGGTETDLTTSYETRLSGTFVATGTKVMLAASCSIEHQSTSANDFLMQIVLKNGGTTLDSYQIGNSYSGASVAYSAILSGTIATGSLTPGTTYTVEVQLRKSSLNGPSFPRLIRYNGLSV